MTLTSAVKCSSQLCTCPKDCVICKYFALGILMLQLIRAKRIRKTYQFEIIEKSLHFLRNQVRSNKRKLSRKKFICDLNHIEICTWFEYSIFRLGRHYKCTPKFIRWCSFIPSITWVASNERELSSNPS